MSTANGAAMRWDHPRVCGEHLQPSILNLEAPGSSPRMRGTLGEIRINDVGGGIIPAYAGNTLCVCVFFGVLWDHPRVCGEHRHQIRLAGFAAGSSPRMRGTLVLW